MLTCIADPKILPIIIGFRGGRPKDWLDIALVCKTLFDVAVPQLWERAPPIPDIFRVMGQTVWEESSGAERLTVTIRDEHHLNVDVELTVHATSLRLLRVLTKSEWQRFSFYAQHIKELVPPPPLHNLFINGVSQDVEIPSPKFCFQDDAQWILSLNRPLCPNLCRLGLVPSMLPYADSFMGSNLTDITLHHMHQCTDGISFVQFLPILCPGLMRIDLGTFPVGTSLAERFAHEQSALVTFKCGILSTEAYLRFASIPNLEWLSFSWSDNPARVLDRMRVVSGAFPVAEFVSDMESALEHFTPEKFAPRTLAVAEVESVHHLILIVNSAPLPNLNQLIIRAASNSPIVGSAAKWRSIFSALNGRCDKEILRSLTIKPHDFIDRGRSITPVHEAAVLTITTLTPLLCFYALRTFECESVSGFDIGDSELRMLGNAWPAMEHLSLTSTLGWAIPSRITLKGLASLLMACPRLCSLGLVIDATLHDQSSSAEPAIRNYNIRTVEFGNSPIEEWYHVAAYLSDIFPNLCSASGGIKCWGVQAHDPMLAALNVSAGLVEQYAGRWREVEQAVEVFSSFRSAMPARQESPEIKFIRHVKRTRSGVSEVITLPSDEEASSKKARTSVQSLRTTGSAKGKARATSFVRIVEGEDPGAVGTVGSGCTGVCTTDPEELKDKFEHLQRKEKLLQEKYDALACSIAELHQKATLIDACDGEILQAVTCSICLRIMWEPFA
ncbi:hypothetical protein PLICRDRAFT_175665 [Plicaturopsis crispa FD-325 SS-3]|nr:hypothetical protein PLICRDRAFT_175665 [Plicaturopsis crispa FD-325 SS-3]